MTHAYDELYLKDAMRNVGAMAHFCINEYGLTAKDFSDRFMMSHVAEQISKGNPRYLVGHSGKELADIFLSSFVDENLLQSSKEQYSITPEYWAGWALAYYQWISAKSFAQILSSGLSYDKVLKMYNPLHEADLSKFVEVVGKR